MRSTAGAMPLLLMALVPACATGHGRAFVAEELARRAGHGLSPAREPGPPELPAGVTLDDGVTEDEAVALALWNNAAFQAELARLGIARADVLDAALPPNPLVSVLSPVGAKPFELSIFLAIDWLWQLPNRLRAARREQERTAHGLVQTGLDVGRDARVAHADAVLAGARAGIAARNVEQWRQSAELFAARARAGDLSELEARTADADLAAAREGEARARQEARVARERLRWVLGLDRAVDATPGPLPPAEPTDVETLVERALGRRPDVRAAALAIDAASARVGWERSKVLSFSGVINAKTVADQGVLTGPGFQVTLPIFQQNQGGIGRARAEVERAGWSLVGLRQRAALDVREAHAQLERALATLAAWHKDVVGAREAGLAFARSTYEDGEQPFLVVIDATRRLDEARVREAELEAEVRRAAAQLERSVGGRLDARP